MLTVWPVGEKGEPVPEFEPEPPLPSCRMTSKPIGKSTASNTTTKTKTETTIHVFLLAKTPFLGWGLSKSGAGDGDDPFQLNAVTNDFESVVDGWGDSMPAQNSNLPKPNQVKVVERGRVCEQVKLSTKVTGHAVSERKARKKRPLISKRQRGQPDPRSARPSRGPVS
jgi:hypothetical protein